MADFLDANGLRRGLIPAGAACAFQNECGLRQDDRCPTAERPRDVDFSCGAARFFSMVRETKREKEARRG